MPFPSHISTIDICILHLYQDFPIHKNIINDKRLFVKGLHNLNKRETFDVRILHNHCKGVEKLYIYTLLFKFKYIVILKKAHKSRWNIRLLLCDLSRSSQIGLASHFQKCKQFMHLYMSVSFIVLKW